MQIYEIMSKEIFSINCKDSIMETCKRFYRKKIGSLLVLEEGLLKGIVTERDIIAKVVILSKDPLNTTVEEIMSTQLVTINQNADVEEAVRLMDTNKIKKLPVVSDDGNLVGIITTSDIVKYDLMKNVTQ